MYDDNIFFYVRDHLKNILGIVDKNGTIVVQYKCTAYGNPIQTTGSMADTIGQYNHMRYKGYYFDEETGFFYCKTRYYVPEWCRFLNADHIAFAEQSSPVGMNLFVYCANDPINKLDSSGQFAITTLLLGIAIGAAIGAIISFSATVAKDLENGELFDGDVTAMSYVGNTLGGAVAGAGIGACSVLGAAAGVALVAGSTMTISGVSVSGGIAFAAGVGGAFVTGGAGYLTRVAISDQETFQAEDMFIEAGANAISGALTFAGSMMSGILGVKNPYVKFTGNTKVKNFLLNHIVQVAYGVYPTKALLSIIKNLLKEAF